MENEKYYTMFSKDDQAYPLLRIADEDCDKNGRILKVHLEINTPAPRKPVLADFLYAPEDIVSKRIAEAMQQLGMDGIQFIPTELTLPKGEIIEDYICVVVDDNTYKALDEEKSEFTKDEDEDDEDMVFYTIEKIALNRKVLGEIPLKKRLGFRLKEAPGYALYHQSVVDTIRALNPTGVWFQDIEEYEF